MLNVADTELYKQRIAQVFDQVSAGYDSPALRYFPFCAGRVVNWLRPSRGWKVLDVATGTGAMAIPLAQAVGYEGRVMGIDLSEKMLQAAERNIAKMGLPNIDLFEMDGESLEFRAAYFDAVVCGFGLFFIPDMVKSLVQWRRVTKPGARVLFTSFGAKAFQPMLGMFVDDLSSSKFQINNRPLASERLQDAAVCRSLMSEAGLIEIEQQNLQLGYHLKDAQE